MENRPDSVKPTGSKQSVEPEDWVFEWHNTLEAPVVG